MSRPWVLLGLSLLAACIIPDYEIGIEGELPDNASAVRVVERGPTTEDMLEICRRDEDADPGPDVGFCPQVRRTSMPSGLIRPASGDLCVCPGDPGQDLNAIGTFNIYAEDLDLDDADDPEDTLYGVFLLDPDPFSEAPQAAIAYNNYWEHGREGELLDARATIMDSAMETILDRIVASIGREEVEQRVFHIDDGLGSGVVDLCNADNGESVAPGLHDLRFMVSDRPFFRPRLLDSAGKPAFTPSGEPAYGSRQYGVPDLAVGASYDTINFVFECREPTDPDARCNCAEVDG